MDPGGSELESSLPQTENPCLIVEDSQPDSVALEDDPDSSYRALLARRLSSLQPTSQSPVLELISSPGKSKHSQTTSQREKVQSDSTSHPENLLSNLSETPLEHSQVLEVCSIPNAKRHLRDNMESGADSTTPCAQSEEGISQFGLLELSESQALHDEEKNGKSEEKDAAAGSQNQLKQSGLRSPVKTSASLSARSGGSEVSSSSPVESQPRTSSGMSIQAILHSQASEALGAAEEELMSSQDDLFDGDKAGSGVDSTVSEPENQGVPTCTPAHSLRLLHLSGQGTLVQESLSQQSVDFVAATQDNQSQTPVIVPSSPTGDEHAHDSPMDTSRPLEDQSQRREEEPMDTDPAPKPQPSVSTAMPQNSPALAMENILSLPSQPELSHDVFIPTPSQSQSLDSAGRKASHGSGASAELRPGLPKPPPTVDKHQRLTSCHSQPSEALQLEMSVNSEGSVFAQKTQMFAVEEDSQATQIEESAGPFGTDQPDSALTLQDEKMGRNGLHPEPKETTTPVNVSQVPEVKKTSALEGQREKRASSQMLLSEASASVPTNVKNVSEVPGVTKSRLSSSQGSRSMPRSQPSQQAALAATRCLPGSSPEVVPSSCPPAGLPSQSQSQPVMLLSSHSNVPETKPPLGVSVRSLSQPTPHSVRDASDHRGSEEELDGDEEEEEGERMNEEEEDQSAVGEVGSGLFLALSQSQALSPEPMEEEEEEEEEQGVEEATCHAPPSQQRKLSTSKEDSLSVIVLEESQRASQKERSGASQPQRPTVQPVGGSSQGRPMSHSGPGSQPQGKGQMPASPSQAGRVTPTSSRSGDTAGRRDSRGQGTDAPANKSLSDSSQDNPFHFTLPKEGELLRPAVSATPPQLSQLKKTPRHSTPIEMALYCDQSEGDITRESTLPASEISVEESGEEPAAGTDGKLSLRMKLVTPVEEVGSGSDRFSLQKPPLSDEEGSVSKATTVAKAVTSPTVFSRVREVHRQMQVGPEEEVQPSSAPTRGGLFNSPLSQERDTTKDSKQPNSQALASPPSANSAADAIPSQPHPSQPREAIGNGPSVHHHTAQPNGGAAEHPADQRSPGRAERDGSPTREQEVPTSSLQTSCRTPTRQRAVSQQTSLDIAASTTPPSRLRQRAVSQQTSFDAAGPPHISGRGEPETPPSRAPHGPALRRHIRTIQEVRTTVTRIITDVYYEDGREVDRKVTEESEEPVVDCRVLDSDISPSRTGSSLTSGDLADISSLSSKASQHSSGATSGGGQGPVRMPNFAVPSSRGTKSASPRRGGRPPQRARCVLVGPGRADARGSRTPSPLSPRGRGRRGRPPCRSPLSRGGRSGLGQNPHGQPMSSSEEEPFTRVCSRVPGSPVGRGATGRSDFLATSPDSSAGASSFVGLRVVAKWTSNGYFYSGSITKDLGEGRFRLLFDDGYECEVQGKDILLCDPIPLDTEVTALSEDEYFSIGVVKGHKTKGSEFLYSVEKDGQSKWYGRMAVILSVEQGSRLREQFGLGPYEPTTPQTLASDISLDNLVEGKRRRRGNTTGTTTLDSSSSSPRTPGPSGKRKLLRSLEEEKTGAKRGRKSGPKSGQSVAKCNTSGSGADLPSDPNDLVATHGPLPDNTTLFMGFAFMLTTSSESDRESNNPTSDGEDEYVQTAPYNKPYTESQLKAGGGFILKEFNEEQCKAAYQSLLIADQYCRTRTYLLCVAGGVPCVSHIWVKDCCTEKKLLNYRNYLLPAGVGPDERIVEWHPRCSPFKGLKVLLVLEEPTGLWTDLLTMCGAATVKQHHVNKDGSELPAGPFDVVVTGSPCPPELLKRVSSQQAPLVSLEWLIQSLICGERQGYVSNPQYHHAFSH